VAKESKQPKKPRRRAPTPHHDAIREGRELARRERDTAKSELVEILGKGIVFLMGTIGMAWGARQMDFPWLAVILGTALVVLVTLWCFLREMRSRGRADEIRERARTRRVVRRTKRHARDGDARSA